MMKRELSLRFMRWVFAAACLLALAPMAHAVPCGNGIVESGEDCDDGNLIPGDCCSPVCLIEEIGGDCQTCEDGVDNDRNGRIDAEDPGCATLSEYQRAAVVETRPATAPPAAQEPAVNSVLLPGALVGDAVDGRCDVAERVCACPGASPSCQPLGRPCVTDADCLAVPYPLGRSRAGVCAGSDASDPAIGCRPEIELVHVARAIARIPGVEVDPVRLTRADSPFLMSFAGGRQIIDVGSMALSPGVELVLVGEKDSVLVIRVRGEFAMGEKASVVVGGELTADHVLWVFSGEEGRVALGDGARFTGTIVAPERPAIEIGREVQIQGAILAARVAGTEADLAGRPEPAAAAF